MTPKHKVDPEQLLRHDEAVRAAVASETRGLRARVAEAEAEAEELRSLLGFYREAAEASIAPPTWEVRARKGGHSGLVVAQLTDCHFDEVVRPEEVFYLNAYNREIAERRLRVWAEKVVTLPRDYFAGVHIEGLVVLATGDILSGDIHAELRETNESPLLSSLLYWQERLIAALALLENEYDGRVAVHAVVGNHGRLTQKPVFKGRAHSNAEWLLWSTIRDRLADRKSRVSVHVSPSMDANVVLYGKNHLITHGDQFRGGSGISGVLAPLMLGTHRKGQRQTVAQMSMDLMVMGHFHQYLDLPGVIVGGSMKGYDEFAFAHNLRPEPARQALWVTTPERGKTMTMPIELQDREMEGW